MPHSFDPWEDPDSEESKEFFESIGRVSGNNRLVTETGWSYLADAVEAANRNDAQKMANHIKTALLWLRGFYVFPEENRESAEVANEGYNRILDQLGWAMGFADVGDISAAKNQLAKSAKRLLHYGQGHGSGGQRKRLEAALGFSLRQRNPVYRRNSDEALRSLYRKVLVGDELARQELLANIGRLGFDSIEAWSKQPRILDAPTEPYEWASRVHAWLNGDFGKTCWLFQFGQVGTTWIVVLNSSAEDALETAAAWLAEHAPGHLVEPEYELDDQGNCAICGQDPRHDRCEHIDAAEVDLSFTDSGWIGWDYHFEELDYDKAIVSALSCNIPSDVPNAVPLIVYGTFWEAMTYSAPIQRLYYPAFWTEEAVTAAANSFNTDVRWFIHEPNDSCVYVCWKEKGDDPLGKDAADYAPAWTTTGFIRHNMSDSDKWILGALLLLEDS